MYKVAFESEEDIERGNFDKLKEIGIEIEKYAEDNSSRVIIEQEDISKRNFIEELL